MQATAISSRKEEEFLIAYLMMLNQLDDVRSQVNSARNDHERRKSLSRFQNVRKRCKILRSLVFVPEP